MYATALDAVLTSGGATALSFELQVKTLNKNINNHNQRYIVCLETRMVSKTTDSP